MTELSTADLAAVRARATAEATAAMAAAAAQKSRSGGLQVAGLQSVAGIYRVDACECKASCAMLEKHKKNCRLFQAQSSDVAFVVAAMPTVNGYPHYLNERGIHLYHRKSGSWQFVAAFGDERVIAEISADGAVPSNGRWDSLAVDVTSNIEPAAATATLRSKPGGEKIQVGVENLLDVSIKICAAVVSSASDRNAATT